MNIGTFEHWNIGTLEHWNIGTSEHQNIGNWELWNIGILDHSNIGTFEHLTYNQHLVISIALILFKQLKGILLASMDRVKIQKVVLRTYV